MNELTGQYDIYYENTPVGYLHVLQKHLNTEFAASISLTTDKVLRLYCIGDQPVSIGIPIPNGTIMSLHRTFTNRSLAALSLSFINRCELLDAHSPVSGTASSSDGWQVSADISFAFADPDIKAQCANIPNALVKYVNDQIHTAIPICSHLPFPMMPVFCFGRAESINGKPYVVFITQNGEFAE